MVNNKCVRGSFGQFFFIIFCISLKVAQSSGVRTLILESRIDCHVYALNM